MNIHFTGRNIEVTPALKTFATEKLEKLQRRFDQISTIHVIFYLDHREHVTEATVHINGADIHALARSEDMYHAIEELANKLLTQVTKHKEKLTDHR
jgi:putative sigma-54 modulation protein